MDAALEFLSSFLPYIMRFNLYSWLFLAGALVLFVLIFVLGMMVHGAARKILIISERRSISPKSLSPISSTAIS